MLSHPPGHLRRVLMIIVCLQAVALQARAQTASDFTPPFSLDAPVAVPPVVAASSLPVPAESLRVPSSRTLTSLQVSFGVLQALDVASTLRGVNSGLSEANPLMRGLSGHPVALATVKTGAAASTILLMRHVAKRNRAGAIIMMAALDTALSVVVVRNLQGSGTH